MADYNDYQLDEMENAAVEKSKNLKRGIIAGTAALGVGGAAAYAASNIMDPDASEEVILTTDDLLAGANAGAEDEPQEEAAAQTTQEVNVNHHIIIDNPEPPVHDPDIQVDETAILYDENGDVISVYDSGTIDGMDWVAVDTDLNGKADAIGIDENRNGIIEENEIYAMDNQSYQMGQGEHLSAYKYNEDGDIEKVYGDHNYTAYDDNRHNEMDEIHNDWDDERSGETYHDDLAENNIDYNNRGGEQFNASVDEPYHEPEALTGSEEMYAYNNESESYGSDDFAYNDDATNDWSEPSNDWDTASNDDFSAESFDDVYDA